MKDYGDAMALIRKRHYVFFSKSGFTEELESKADDDVILVTLDDMY